jgi:hypothetical protein
MATRTPMFSRWRTLPREARLGIWLLVLSAALVLRYTFAPKHLVTWAVLVIDAVLFFASRVAYRDLRPADATLYDERHSIGSVINGYSCWTALLFGLGLYRAVS